MKTNEQNIEIINQVAQIVGGEVYEGYSGRGMFGASCYGIICSDINKTIEEAAILGLRGARQDNMGKNYIVYWPSVKFV